MVCAVCLTMFLSKVVIVKGFLGIKPNVSHSVLYIHRFGYKDTSNFRMNHYQVKLTDKREMWAIIAQHRSNSIAHAASELIEAEWRIYASVNYTTIGSDNGWTVPCHYLNQCWRIVNWTLRKKLQWFFYRNKNTFIDKFAFESVACQSGGHLVPVSMC